MLHKKLIKVVVTLLIIGLVPVTAVQAGMREQFPVSQGGVYTEIGDTVNSKPQTIRQIEVNLGDPYTELNLTYPNPLSTFASTSSQALKTVKEGKRVVGAVNGSFFDYGSKVPLYLISYENEIVNIGLSTFGTDHYVNKPIAFGIDKYGKALIDRYQLQLNLKHGQQTYEVDNLNKIREADELIIYTPEYKDGYSDTNQYGVEVILSNASKNTNLSFGDHVTATVSGIRAFGDTKKPKIPADGLVLSAHGDKRAILEKMKIGENVELNIGIESKWMDSQFMLAGGPYLVSNGTNVMDMSPTNPRAQERAPRTAIATDKTGTKVYMITVDGRQAGYSSGMTLNEFANYLVKMGFHKALNLDGGGSTTMLARKPGTEYATLINRPSDGWERAVSTTLQVISTAPVGVPAHFKAVLSKTDGIKVGTTADIKVSNLVDQYYNPLTFDPSKVQITSDVGVVEGMTFKATKSGKGTIKVKYGNATQEIPVTVEEEATQFSDIPSDYKYFTEISYLTDQGLIKGYNDGTFKPLKTLSRAEAAILLIRSLNVKADVSPVTFEDVPEDYKYYDVIATVVNAGLMQGKGNGIFDPEGLLTREEMAVILDRGFNLTGEANMAFTDVTTKNFGYFSISALVANDITNGFPDKTYRPKNSLTREQFSLFLYRLIK
ncbi:phosphodiester glycosidase family protein [Rossellomorea sp. NPDC077527]|uniref:phosphodiester glycosidase family protein n=1 Tax=Rossellomorea sp. NPDC077527 TaxID=3364510 RepID=UPI0037CBDD31